MEKIGLIAGNRRFPILFAQAALNKGFTVTAIAIKKDTSPKLKKYVDKLYWLGLNEFSRMFEIFKSEGITKIVMAGQISPRRLFTKELNSDSTLKKMLAGLKDKRADTIFSAIAEEIKKQGFQLIESITFMGEFLPKKAALTTNLPDSCVLEDIYFGLEIAKGVALLDIGQTVAVKHKAIVAVEALEGTDNLIQRAGKISRGGFTVVKVSKPKQDLRFDVPVVGLSTIKNLYKAGGVCLAIEAGKTLFIDQAESIKLAEGKAISIVAV
ncbi:MAG: UDP-2,3-diacylglucosamine diphosphatase LpxI [Candidatus Omnitrophota bacterium]